MAGLDEGLRLLRTLVESTGATIGADIPLLRSTYSEKVAEIHTARLKALHDAAIMGFFHCAVANITFTNLNRVKQHYGRAIEDVYVGATPTFTKLARTYWTFKVTLLEWPQDNSICVHLLRAIDVNFASVFFPTPGPFSPPKRLREGMMRDIIQRCGADFDVEDYIKNNFYLL